MFEFAVDGFLDFGLDGTSDRKCYIQEPQVGLYKNLRMGDELGVYE